MVRGFLFSAITCGCFFTAARAADKPRENAQAKDKEAQTKEELVKRLKDLTQTAAGAAADNTVEDAREKLVDEMLKLATDKDGKATWTQAIANSRKFVGQAQYFANEDQRKQYLESMDLNKDGLVDRYEARRMIAQRGGGGDFLFNGGF